DDWLTPGPWRVVALGGQGDPANLHDLWESVCRRHAWQHPLLTDLDGRVYAVVRAAQDDSPGSWGWLTTVVDVAGGEDLGLTARAGRPAYRPVELERSKAEANEADRAVSQGDPARTHEELWA